MNLIKRLTKIYFVCVLLASCNQDEEKVETSKPQRLGKPVSHSAIKSCTTVRVLEVLGDARTVVSREARDKNALYLWDAFSGKLKKKIDFSVKYQNVSHDGEYILRKISYKRYQLSRVEDDNIVYSERLTFDTSSEPTIKFDRESKYIISMYRSRLSAFGKKIMIYDINKKDMIDIKTVKGALFADMLNEEAVIVAKRDFGKNIIMVYNPRSERTHEFHVARGSKISKMIVSKETVVLKIRNFYYAYDIRSGGLLYRKELKSFYTSDFESGKALISTNWNDIKILDMRTGEFISSLKTPSEVELSKCKMTENATTLVCKDRVNQGKVYLWSLLSNEGHSTCY
jgi:hypothetical protein